MKDMYIGIDVGGTSIKYALVNERGEVSERAFMPTSLEKKSFLFDLVKIIRDFQKKNKNIKGVGISAPGVIQKDGKMTTAGAIKSLYGINLKDEIEQQITLPVFVENDANAAAIAENWIGNAQGIENYLCVVLGTGMGGGIVINGEVYRGRHGMAGEFGWMMIDRLPKKGDIEVVSLNQRAAVVGGLCYRYNQAMKKINPEFQKITDARVILEQEDSNEIAKKILQQFYQDLSMGIMNLISCFDPEVVLIGGGISENDHFFERLTQTLETMEKRHGSIAFLKEKGMASIEQTKLGNDAGLIGAVYQIHKLVKKN